MNICFSPEILTEGMITTENAFSLLSLTAFNELCRESDGARISFLGNECREIEELLHAMERESKERQSSWMRVMENYLNILITKMLRKIEVSLKEREIGDVWRELSKYIDDNLSSEHSLPFLAKKCFYNPSYFSRAFKEKFGMPLTKYVSTRRVERAIILLKEGKTCEEIADTVGFSSKSALYRAFLREKGVSLSDYRKK